MKQKYQLSNQKSDSHIEKRILLLFVCFTLFAGILSNLLNQNVIAEEYVIYSSKMSEYDEDFPDTFQMAIPAHWNTAEYDRRGFRNQRYLRTDFYQSYTPLLSRPAPYIKIHWRAPTTQAPEATDWLWSEVIGESEKENFAEKSKIRFGLSHNESMRYDIDEGIAILTKLESGDFAIVIHARDETVAKQLFEVVSSSFVVSYPIDR